MNLAQISFACVLTITATAPLTFSAYGQANRTSTPTQTVNTASRNNESAESYPAPTSRDALRMAAININAARSKAFARGDSAAIAALYTDDAVYVELMPRLVMMNGHQRIKAHFDQLFSLKATELTVDVTSAEMVTPTTQLIGGDYAISTMTKRIMGHFVQTLRLDNGTWKIASHVFARPDSIGEYEIYTADQ